MTGRLDMVGASRHFGRRPVILGVDLKLRSGDRLVVTGANGAGKTTLLRMAAGQLRPTNGRVTKDGHNVLTPLGRRGLAVVAHDAPAYLELTVHEQVHWWGRMHGVNVDADSELHGAGLRRMAAHRVADLSRGQRQRLSIAMALACRPDLLVLDEPTMSLDADGQDWLVRTLQRSQATMLAASHDPDFAACIDARTLHLEQGRLVDGPEKSSAGHHPANTGAATTTHGGGDEPQQVPERMK